MIPGDKINLDTLQINAGGVDLYYYVKNNGQPELAPEGSALFSIYGAGTPGYNDCASAPLTSLAIPFRNLNAGAYLCYRTDQGLFGYLRLLSLDATNNNTLSIQVLTWSQP